MGAEMAKWLDRDVIDDGMGAMYEEDPSDSYEWGRLAVRCDRCKGKPVLAEFWGMKDGHVLRSSIFDCWRERPGIAGSRYRYGIDSCPVCAKSGSRHDAPIRLEKVERCLQRVWEPLKDPKTLVALRSKGVIVMDPDYQQSLCLGLPIFEHEWNAEDGSDVFTHFDADVNWYNIGEEPEARYDLFQVYDEERASNCFDSVLVVPRTVFERLLEA